MAKRKGCTTTGKCCLALPCLFMPCCTLHGHAVPRHAVLCLAVSCLCVSPSLTACTRGRGKINADAGACSAARYCLGAVNMGVLSCPSQSCLLLYGPFGICLCPAPPEPPVHPGAIQPPCSPLAIVALRGRSVMSALNTCFHCLLSKEHRGWFMPRALWPL